MLLYDKNGISLDIYIMNPKFKEIKKYKEKELKQINQEELYYIFKTSSIESLNSRKIILSNEKKSTIEQLKLFDIKEQKKIVEEYIEGKYRFILPTRVIKMNKDNNKYYFLNTNRKKTISKRNENDYELKNIINLSKNLYLLQLLEQGMFRELINEDISQQLKLFDISLVKTIIINNNEKIVSFGLSADYNKQILSKKEFKTKILRKI